MGTRQGRGSCTLWSVDQWPALGSFKNVAVQSAASSRGCLCLCRGGPVRPGDDDATVAGGGRRRAFKSSQVSVFPFRVVRKGAEGCSNEAGIGLESPCSAPLHSSRPSQFFKIWHFF